MNKTDAFKILKLSLGSSLAIFIASIFNLQYSIVAGVITLLVVKDTKRETVVDAIGKLLGFVICTVYSYLCFNILGFNLYSFSIYILLIISTCFILKIRYVIAMCVVISSHYLLQESMSLYWILNETGLFIIGAGIGIIINMFMLSNIEQIYNGQERLQKEVSTILIDIASTIVNPNKESDYEEHLDRLNILINKSTKAAYENLNNNLLSDTRFFLEHMEIIKSQKDILATLYNLALQLNYVPYQGYIIAEFINKIGNTSFETNTVNLLLEDLEDIFKDMKSQPLPKNRDEFENRAILFLCLTELKKFLINRKNAQTLRDNFYYNN
ncbi:hypothetical protein H9L25_02980 [Terrisporobacter mayombei]|nr:hypothetical protein [Terrisporobacter mayombei]